ncbi:hypothetical protein HK096_000982, partial [Nowakowskiella sp. JEL0078]
MVRIVRFPICNVSDVEELLRASINLDNCRLDNTKVKQLSGRPRFCVRTIEYFISEGDKDEESKQSVLDKALEYAVNQASIGIRDKVDALLNDDPHMSNALLLSRMVLAWHLNDGKITFARDSESDFVDKALCALHAAEDNKYEWEMDEPLVVEIVKEKLKEADVDEVFFTSLDLINSVLSNSSTSATSKGNAFEPIVRQAVRRFNGILVSELPFLSNHTNILPAWCKTHRILIDEIKTATEFGYSMGLEGDLQFLMQRPKRKMLVELPQTRQDGIWFFDKSYAGSLAIKFYSTVTTQLHFLNTVSSDIRKCFTFSDGTKPNPKAISFYTRFFKS